MILVNNIIELVENGRFIPRVRVQKNTSSADSNTKPSQNSASYSKLYLRVPDMNSRKFFEAQRIVDTSRGDVKVIFYDSSTSSYRESGKGVRISVSMMDSLVGLLGADNVVIK